MAGGMNQDDCNQIMEELGAMQENLVSKQDVQNLQRAIEKINATIYGNGREGLTTQVAMLSRAVGKLEKAADKVIWLLVAAVVTALLSLILKFPQLL
jgi:hypothetical protein